MVRGALAWAMPQTPACVRRHGMERNISTMPELPVMGVLHQSLIANPLQFGLSRCASIVRRMAYSCGWRVALQKALTLAKMRCMPWFASSDSKLLIQSRATCASEPGNTRSP